MQNTLLYTLLERKWVNKSILGYQILLKMSIYRENYKNNIFFNQHFSDGLTKMVKQLYSLKYWRKSVTNLFLLIFLGKSDLFGTFWSIFQKISIVNKTKKLFPKLVSLEDIWQISEFLTKNCILLGRREMLSQKSCYFQFSQNIEIYSKRWCQKYGFFDSYPFQKCVQWRTLH